jgi:hypothetical protein
MKEFQSNLNINFGWLAASFMVLLFAFYMRIGFHEFMTVTHYLNIFSVAVLIFVLPEFLSSFSFLSSRSPSQVSWSPSQVSRSTDQVSWTQTAEFYTILTILMLSGIGLLMPFLPFFGLFIYGIWVGAALLIIWSIWNIRNSFNVVPLLLAAILGFILVLDLFHSEGVTPLFYERIVLGTGFIDTLNHAAISNIFSQHLASSTGVDGIVHYSYHWGSHALFGGLKNLVGVDSIAFYNVVYPAIFLILLFKVLFNFIARIGTYYENFPLNGTMILVVMLIVFSVELFVTRVFTWMESTTVANIFMILYLNLLFVYSKRDQEVKATFFMFTFLILMLISIVKISHGFVLTAAIGYLALRFHANWKMFLSLTISGLALLWIVLNYVLFFDQVADVSRNLSGNLLIYYIFKRMEVFWSNSGMSWSYFAGILVSVLGLLRLGYLTSFKSLKNAFLERKMIPFELLILMNILGLAGAVIVSEHGLDVFFFLSLQLLLSTLFVIYLVVQKVHKYELKSWYVTILSFVIFAMALVSRPEMIDHMVRKGSYLRDLQEMSSGRQHLHALMGDLMLQSRRLDAKKTAIYIPQSEHWYYASQSNMISAPFIAPSLSGFVLIGGISEQIWFSEISRYGYNVYRNRREVLIYDVNEAMNQAKLHEFESLLVYRVEDGALKSTLIDL